MENLLKFVQESREVKWNKMNTDDLEEGSKNQVKYVRNILLMSRILESKILKGEKSS